MTDKTKRCYKCKEHKPFTEFYKNKTQADGFASDCNKCHRVAVKKWQKNNPDKWKAWQSKSYKKRYAKPEERRKILDRNITYNKANRKQINEWQRKRRYKKLGRPVRLRTFVFYRDVVKQWMRETVDTSAPKWKQLLSLPLTPKQRNLVELCMQGMTVVEIARKLKRQQSSITKMWNGDNNNKGGIYSKVKKWAPNLLDGTNDEDKHNEVC